LQDVFFKLRLPFDCAQARQLSARIQEEVYFQALATSAELAAAHGRHPAFAETRAAAGVLHVDHYPGSVSDPARWEALRARIAQVGLRNSLLVAIAPTATIASIAGCGECIEPQVSNLFKRETLSGDFLQVNRYLIEELKALGLWNETMRARIKDGNGSIQRIEEIPAEVRAIFRTAWEIPMRSLIDMAADRAPFIDQSQSLNLFMESPSIGALSAMYFHAWKKGLKTTYYLRSRPATEIGKTTVRAPANGRAAAAAAPPVSAAAPIATPAVSEAAALACSLENPESCEACQ
jgi:ribonucleoside-diphosphate reductase alpha chain